MSRYKYYALHNIRAYSICLLFMLLGIGFDALIPVVINHLIDDVVASGSSSGSLVLLFLLFSCFICRGSAKYIQEYTSDKISQSVRQEARSQLFNHIIRQNGGFFIANSPSQLMSRVRHDAESLGFAFGFIGVFLAEIVVHVAVMLCFLFSVSPQVFLVALAVMPVIGLLAFREETRGDRIYDEISDETVLLNKTAGEALSGIRTVRSFGCEAHERERFSRRNRRYYQLNVSLENLFGRYDGATSSLGRIMVALCLLAGGLCTMTGRMTLGQLAASLEYVNSLVWPMLEIGWVLSSLAQAAASARKISAVLDTDCEVRAAAPVQDVEAACPLVFDSVSFSAGGRDIIRDISFRLDKGRTLGIMGSSGSGKSTIVNLMLRFLDPTGGRILLGGIDIRHLEPDRVRDCFAIVDQETVLFSESVRENLKKGRQEEAGEPEMIEASRLAQAHGFVSSLPEDYSTVIGERGVGLSGGQKQRLSIARALLRQAPVLVLDDSTSALDMETEKRIQEALDGVQSGGMKIIIAHRASSVRNADEIIYLEDGVVAERGNHASLMAEKGLYYDTWCAQNGKEEE